MAGNHDHGFAHPCPPWILFTTFFTLIALTILTVITAGQPYLGPFAVFVSMGIATIKATLVALFFMHMFWDKPINILTFLSSFFFVSLFIGFTLLDTDHYQNQINAFPREPLIIPASAAPAPPPAATAS